MRRPRPLRTEDGAVVPFVAVVMTLLVVVAAFAVDLGMQRVVRRDVQSLSDIVALDLVRRLDGRATSTVLGDNQFRSAVVTSVTGNADGVLGDAPDVVVEVGTFDADPDGDPTTDDGTFTSYGSLDYTVGDANTSGAATLQSTAIPTAVRVTTSGAVGFAFVPGTGGAVRSAVAEADSGGCFSLGSYAARIDTGDSFILGPLLGALGTGASLSLLDAQGLADTSITAAGLLGTDLTAGGFDELLTTTVTLSSLYLAAADVLQAQGDTAAATILNGLASTSLGSATLQLGSLLALDTGTSTAAEAAIDVFSLVAGAAFLANGTNPIAVPNLTVSVPGISALTASVTIGQKPIVVCGRAGATDAEVSQVDLTLSGTLANVNLGLARISAPISVSVSLDPADASFDALTCDVGDRQLDFTVSSGLLDTQVLLGSTTNANALKVEVYNVLPPGWVSVANGYVVVAGQRAAGSTETGSILVTDGDYENAPVFEAGDGSLGLPAVSASSHLTVLSGTLVGTLVTGVLGGLVNGVVNPLVSVVVTPVLSAVETSLLDPLLQSLGINVTGADVHAVSHSECDFPRLAQ